MLDKGPSSNGTVHFHLDHLGSVRMITDSEGMRYGRHDYYPFGGEQTSSIQELTNFGHESTEPLRFTGHERDYHGLTNVENTDYLDFMHARQYDPNLGRFLSVDPVLGIPTSPQSWNRYAYVLNNPVNMTDPTGAVRCDERLPDGHQPEGDCIQSEARDPWSEAHDEARRQMDIWLLNGMTKLSNFSAGFGDSLTFGFTSVVRDFTGDNGVVDKCSMAYLAGEYTEIGAELAITAGGSGLRVAASQVSRRAVRAAARRQTARMARAENQFLHHIQPLFGHPGGAGTMFPTVVCRRQYTAHRKIFKPCLMVRTLRPIGISVHWSVLLPSALTQALLQAEPVGIWPPSSLVDSRICSVSF